MVCIQQSSVRGFGKDGGGGGGGTVICPDKCVTMRLP